MMRRRLKGNRLHPHPEDLRFQRHVRSCNNADWPGSRKPFLIGDQIVGYVSERIESALKGRPFIQHQSHRLVLLNAAALPEIARDLASLGLFRWRGEAFDVRAQGDGQVLTQIDRGALPSFGIQACGIHVNGLVWRRDELHLWVARRSTDKLLDPGKLDNIVAGGVPAGLNPVETLVKEAAEEAAIPADLAATAVQVGTIQYAMERPEGLRRDILYCYDLTLPGDFIPRATDGEVAAFELWPVAKAIETVKATDDFKFNVNLVLIDLFLRKRLIEPAPPAGQQSP